jgi:hypothetical protein
MDNETPLPNLAELKLLPPYCNHEKLLKAAHRMALEIKLELYNAAIGENGQLIALGNLDEKMAKAITQTLKDEEKNLPKLREQVEKNQEESDFQSPEYLAINLAVSTVYKQLPNVGNYLTNSLTIAYNKQRAINHILSEIQNEPKST